MKGPAYMLDNNQCIPTLQELATVVPNLDSAGLDLLTVSLNVICLLKSSSKDKLMISEYRGFGLLSRKLFIVKHRYRSSINFLDGSCSSCRNFLNTRRTMT